MVSSGRHLQIPWTLSADPSGIPTMARFSARYAWALPQTDQQRRPAPDPAEPLTALIGDLDLQLEASCPTGLAATGTDSDHGLQIRLVLSWSRLAAGTGPGLEITAELLSNEAMATGAPLSRTCFQAVHDALLEQLPELRLILRSDGRQRDGRAHESRRRSQADPANWLVQAA